MALQINQSVAVLCDGNNIERSIHDVSGSTSSMVNFDKLIPKLLNNRGLNRMLYFREGKAISSKFADRLHENFYGSVIPCHKSADIPLSIKATQLASKVDTIIIMSGDSDYVDLVTHLKSEGVRVEIAAIRKTTAWSLIDAADFFHAIVEEDWFVYNSGKKSGSNYLQNRPNNTNKARTLITPQVPSKIKTSSGSKLVPAPDISDSNISVSEINKSEASKSIPADKTINILKPKKTVKPSNKKNDSSGTKVSSSLKTPTKTTIDKKIEQGRSIKKALKKVSKKVQTKSTPATKSTTKTPKKKSVGTKTKSKAVAGKIK